MLNNLLKKIRAKFEPAGDALQRRATLSLTATVMTDVGCVRQVNEDAGRLITPNDPADEHGSLAIVADGMGGHAAGEVASQLAIEVIRSGYYQSRQDPRLALAEAFRAANQSIYRAAQENEALRGMGTTCTALLLVGDSALCAHVGDSRLYLIRDNEIFQMSEDDSMVRELVRHGALTERQARYHEDRNVILRALGTQPEVEINLWPDFFPVRTGDQFVLCSDGLSDLVEDDEIKRQVAGADTHAACEGLIALARARGGHDNITVGIFNLAFANGQERKPVRDTREFEVVR